VLSMFGRRVPLGLRMFLLGVAVFDDVIAVAIIAVFYTAAIKWVSLVFACGIGALLLVYNQRVKTLPPFLFAWAALWAATLDSGVSPTVAGVVLGLALPVEMGRRVLRFLHGPVTFGIVPIFVFANSGVSLDGVTLAAFQHPVSVGAACGLFFGKQLGIFAASVAAVKTGWAKLPHGVGWGQLYAVAAICGIGFTMSLFIGTLAFGDGALMGYAKVGVLTGSLASAVEGVICMTLLLILNKKPSGL